ncbi:MAG: hypothetical protein LBL45_06065 [Treponema sp.]|jgi:hypothetical protein|nr:hypothetical protein [Treponema sp.]
MARNIAEAVKADTSKLPLLALPPVQLAEGADSREADALAQILAVRLIRSGKYAVYPRTKSLEQVQEEYGNQFNGDTADEYLPNIGRAGSPRLVLSVTARRLGSRNMFNAAVINLETGIQEAGDTVNYQSVNDGMKAMEDLALKLVDPEKAAAEAARARAEQEAAAKAQAEQERLAAEASAARYNSVVSDNASFTQAIIAINNDKTANSTYTITLNGNFTSPPVTFTGNAAKTIAIKGDASVRTIWSNGSGVLFTVPEGITLVLDNNITLNGNNNKKNVIVRVVGGTLVMKNGSIVRGSQGGGVSVENGAFTMSGGTISGNSASPDGGGVSVRSNGTFTMSGGTVSGNSTSSTSGGGGGVYVSANSVFIKSGGGTIDNTNSAGTGKVVYVYDGTKRGKERKTTAGSSVNLDSRVSGRRGGWQ